MYKRRPVFSAVLMLGLLVLGMVGWVEAANSKQLMLVFTTDTGAELNPCG